MTTILTTTGISLYTNTKRTQKTDVPTDEQMRQYLLSDAHSASSEANSLLQMSTSHDFLVFVCTKDSRAVVSAKLLADFFEGKGYKRPKVVEIDFQGNAQQIEAHGLRNLVNALISEIGIAQEKSQDIVINATAGLKAQVVYSTMIGMLYHIPVKYIYEEFKNLMTFNPIALEWDTSIFLTYSDFFTWLDEEPRKQQDVENWLKAIYERERVETLLESPDADGEVFLSPMGEVLWRQFKQEEKEARIVEWPASAEIENIESKITLSDHKRDKKRGSTIENFCLKVAALDCVRTVICSNFENTTKARIKQVSASGSVILLWAGNGFAQNVIVHTTAQGKPQTLKVAEKIREMLEK